MPDPKTEAKIDDMVDDTFPASDPPSTTPTGGTRKSREIAEAHASNPAGGPTDDRLATETAASRQEGSHPTTPGQPTPKG